MAINMKSPKSPLPGLEQIAASVPRRQVLMLVAAPLLWSFSTTLQAADAAACFDFDALPASQKSTRRSLGFKPATPETNNCGQCAFFTPSAGACGNCAMLSGGAVSTAYVCESWAAKS
jgi:High potential iron-sulfur protein